MTAILLVLAFVAVFLALVLLLQAATGRDVDPSGASAAFAFRDPRHEGPVHEPDRDRRRLVVRAMAALAVAAVLVVLAALTG